MMLSLNCLILGRAFEQSLTENIGETYTDDSGVKISFSKFTVSTFKEKLFRRGEVKVIVRNSGEIDLWNVDSKKVVEEKNNLKEFTVDDIKDKLGGVMMIGQNKLKSYFDKMSEEEEEDIHVFIVSTSTATGQKRHADSESVDTKPKRKKDIPTLESLIVDLEEKIPLDRPPKLYPISNIAGRFHKRDIPISSREYVDMRLDVETTDTGRKLIDNLKNETKACYLLYAVSGAGKTRAIFDMSMNENGIYVVYVECRPSSDISNRDYEPTADRNFAQLVASIGSAFGPYNDTINNSAREEAKRLIILEFTARVLYLILLKKKFPNITPRDYLLSQLNGGQECIASIRDSLVPIEYTLDELQIVIRSALRYLKDKLPGQKSLIFAIDESNVASNKLFSGYFRNINQHPRGLLTPMIEILRLFEISIVIAGTAFTLKQGSDIQSDIGKGDEAKYITNFSTIDSKDIEAYMTRYLDLSGCEIDNIEDSKYLVGRPRLVARLVKEIIDAENQNPQESKQAVLETAVNKTVQLIKNGMTRHLEEMATEAYNKKDLGNEKLQEILMTLFINCWFFNGYISKSEVNDYSAKLVDCGIASLKSDKDRKFLQVKEPLAIETVKNVLYSRYKSPTEPLIKKLFEELQRSVDYGDNSNTSKGIMWQYFVIGRLIDFNNKTVSEFVNEIYGDDQPHLPDWTREAIIKIESYGNLQMLFRLDETLKDDVDVIKKFLTTSTPLKYVFVPGQYMRPDGVYIGKLALYKYWTLLISAKMYTNKLSGKDVDDDNKSTDWSFMYHQKDGKVKCTNLKGKFDGVISNFDHCGSLRIHYILPGVAQERTPNQSNQSNRGGCYTENNDVIMYIDEKLLERYFPKEYTSSLREILMHH